MPDAARVCGECAGWALIVNETLPGCLTSLDGCALGCCARAVAAGTATSDTPEYVYARIHRACRAFRAQGAWRSAYSARNA